MHFYVNIVAADMNEIMSYTIRTAEVRSFTLKHGYMHQVPIVDATIRYNDMRIRETYSLIVRDALNELRVCYKLTLTSIMREVDINA